MLVSPTPVAMLSVIPSVASTTVLPDAASSSSPVIVVLVSRAERRPSAVVHIVPSAPLVWLSLAEGAVSKRDEKSAMRFSRWSRVSTAATVPAGSSPSSKPSLCSRHIGAPMCSIASPEAAADGYGAPTTRGSTGGVAAQASAVSVTATASSLGASLTAASAPAAAASFHRPRRIP